MDAELAGNGDQEDDDNDTGEATLPRIKWSKVGFAKELRLFGQSNPITYDGRFGDVTYSLKAADGSTINVYSKDTSDAWVLEGSGATVTGLSSTKEYYVEAGVQYTAEESFTSNEMVQEAVRYSTSIPIM